MIGTLISGRDCGTVDRGLPRGRSPSLGPYASYGNSQACPSTGKRHRSRNGTFPAARQATGDQARHRPKSYCRAKRPGRNQGRHPCEARRWRCDDRWRDRHCDRTWPSDRQHHPLKARQDRRGDQGSSRLRDNEADDHPCSRRLGRVARGGAEDHGRRSPRSRDYVGRQLEDLAWPRPSKQRLARLDGVSRCPSYAIVRQRHPGSYVEAARARASQPLVEIDARDGVLDIATLVMKGEPGNGDDEPEGCEMADGLMLEFEGVGQEQYDAVNARLGIDQVSGKGDWPAGLVFHAGGAKPGGWVVFEVWESKEAQERFMNERLGRALQEGGITDPPTRAEWLELAAYNSPGA